MPPSFPSLSLPTPTSLSRVTDDTQCLLCFSCDLKLSATRRLSPRRESTNHYRESPTFLFIQFGYRSLPDAELFLVFFPSSPSIYRTLKKDLLSPLFKSNLSRNHSLVRKLVWFSRVCTPQSLTSSATWPHPPHHCHVTLTEAVL